MTRYQECTHCAQKMPCEMKGVPIVPLSADRPILVVREMKKDECDTFLWGAK